MQSLTVAIPSPRSWINALGLILLMIGLEYGIAYIWIFLSPFLEFVPQIGSIFGLIVQIIIISLIAFLHHWLHRFLDNFFPETKIPEAETADGIFPGIFSWWEGFYGWLVTTLSGYIAFCVADIFLLSSKTYLANFLLFAKADIPNLLTVQNLIRLIIAAYLYQLQYLITQRLLSAGR
jgi:hypothetical protein